jgi:hypothetical protein
MVMSQPQPLAIVSTELARIVRKGNNNKTSKNETLSRRCPDQNNNLRMVVGKTFTDIGFSFLGFLHARKVGMVTNYLPRKTVN